MKHLILLKIQNMMDIKGLASMVYKFFDKKTKSGGFRILLCVIDIFSKYAWVVPLKDKKGIIIVNAF